MAICQMDQQRQQKGHAEIMKALFLKATLKGHDHHAGGHHIHDELTAASAKLLADHLCPAQNKPYAGQYKQNEYLLADGYN